jgi:hypothetical protein
MAATDPPAHYQVVYSAFVENRLEELSDEAVARGDGAAFAAALAEFRRRLALYPQFGDPQIDLTAVTGLIYQGIIRPLSMRYGVLEERRLVFAGSPPVLLPLARPDSPAEGERAPE